MACLQTVLALDGVRDGSIGLGVGVSFDEASDGLSEKLEVIKRVVALHLLVKVRVEGDLLDVLAVAQLHKGLAGSVVGVEKFLEGVKDKVGGSVGLVVLGQVGRLDLGLGGKTLATVHEGNNLLGSHAARLGGKVDSLSGALGDVSGGISDKGDTSLDTARAVVLGDRVSLDLDDLSSLNLVTGTVADGLLVLLDGRAVDDGSRSDTDVVVLGEDPSVEIGRDVVTDVHLGHLLVELHLFVRDLDALLEGNGVVVLSGIHGLGDTGVGTVGSDNKVNLHLTGGSDRLAGLELLVLEGVPAVGVLAVVGRDINGRDETVDDLGSVLDGPVTEVGVEDLTTAHANVLIGLEGLTDVDFDTGGGDEVHLTDLLLFIASESKYKRRRH